MRGDKTRISYKAAVRILEKEGCSSDAPPSAIVTEMLKNPKLKRSRLAVRNTLIEDVRKMLKNGNEPPR
jgi:hypothetical protein